MFWGGVIFNRRTPLIPIQQNMSFQMYVEKVITPIFYPIRNELDANIVFIENNYIARVHGALEARRIILLH